MPDERMDTLLLEIAERARNATSLPPFETVRRRGLVRRRNQWIGIGVAAAVVAATLVAGVSSLTDNDASGPVPTVPDRSALPDPGKPTLADHGDTPIDQLSPDEVVHDARAKLQMSMPLTSVGTSGVAATWRLCSGGDCRDVVAVSTDDFATAGYLDLKGNRLPIYADAGDGAVMVADGTYRQPVQILGPDGSAQENAANKQASPLQDGEGTVNALRYLDNLQSFFGKVGPVAVDSQTATTHPIPTPEDMIVIGGLQPNGLLEGFGSDLGGGSTVALWSTDGGSSWNQHVVDSTGTVSPWVVSTGDAQTLAFRLDGQGGNHDSLDWSPMLRSLDGGDRWEEAPVGRTDDASQVPQAGGYAAAIVLPDNSLLMSVESWSDGAEPGIYRSAGEDWSTLQRVEADLPASAVTTSKNSPWGFDLQAPLVDADTGANTLYAVDLHQQLFTSIDEGQTWTQVRAR